MGCGAAQTQPSSAGLSGDGGLGADGDQSVPQLQLRSSCIPKWPQRSEMVLRSYISFSATAAWTKLLLKNANELQFLFIFSPLTAVIPLLVDLCSLAAGFNCCLHTQQCYIQALKVCFHFTSKSKPLQKNTRYVCFDTSYVSICP